MSAAIASPGDIGPCVRQSPATTTCAALACCGNGARLKTYPSADALPPDPDDDEPQPATTSILQGRAIAICRVRTVGLLYSSSRVVQIRARALSARAFSTASTCAVWNLAVRVPIATREAEKPALPFWKFRTSSSVDSV